MKIYLTDGERELVAAQRKRLHGEKNGSFPHIVLRALPDGEVETIYAFSRRMPRKGRTARIDIMAVATTATTADRIWYRNLEFAQCRYRVADWNRPKDGNDWGWLNVSQNGRGEIPGPVANPEALAGTAYAYAGIDEGCWETRPAAYLRTLRRHPGAELLFKAGLTDLIKPSILKAGRPMATFIARHRDEIAKLEANAETVITAFRRNEPLALAHERTVARHELGGIARPKGVDTYELAQYLRKAGITKLEYIRHAEHCEALGLGEAAWMPAPRNFRHVAEEVEAMHARKMCRRDRIKAAKEREAKRSRSRRFAAAQEALYAKAKVRLAGIVAIWPCDPASLSAEGEAMHNCIGNGLYEHEVADGRSAIVFLREASTPDAPWCDVELRLKGRRWEVAQCYTRNNYPAPPEAKEAAKAIAAELSKKRPV